MTPLSEAELEALYVKLEKPVYNIVYRWVWEREEARDIVQEAFVRLWKMRGRVERGTAKALVYRIALNLAASRRRWQKIRSWLPLDTLRSAAAAGPGVEDGAIHDERTERMRVAILALPDDMRTTVLLTEYSELDYGAIGEILGVAPGTVASRRHRAIERLRKELDEDAPGAGKAKRETAGSGVGVV